MQFLGGPLSTLVLMWLHRWAKSRLELSNVAIVPLYHIKDDEGAVMNH